MAYATNGKLQIPLPPEDNYQTQRRFIEWVKHPAVKDAFYQGQINLRGECDGVGVTIVMNKCLNIAHWKNNNYHGHVMTIDVNGNRVLHACKDGKKDGIYIISRFNMMKNDFESYKAFVYENDELLVEKAEREKSEKAEEEKKQEDGKKQDEQNKQEEKKVED